MHAQASTQTACTLTSRRRGRAAVVLRCHKAQSVLLASTAAMVTVEVRIRGTALVCSWMVVLPASLDCREPAAAAVTAAAEDY
jgi:hypothetical protein